ncbi:hypothetical protein [Neobacillus niacini]|nr:hypothetical protein [Neobacillus niacini]MCM3765019.1 hypothetical protein [Neobacillus niacini]
MALWWTMTFGLVLCLGIVGGTMVHFLRNALDSDDAKRIDKLPVDKDPK